jgi:hypothetical protein
MCVSQTVLTPQAREEIQVELYDKDMDSDDFLGRCVLTGQLYTI